MSCNLHPDAPCRGFDECGHCQDLPSSECPYCGRERERRDITPGGNPECEFCGLREDGTSVKEMAEAAIRVINDNSTLSKHNEDFRKIFMDILQDMLHEFRGAFDWRG